MESGADKREETYKIFAFLLVIIPIVSNIVFGFIDYRDNIVGSAQSSMINLEQPPESAYISIDGAWVRDETAETLYLSVENLEYILKTPDATTHGHMEITEYSVELNENGQEIYFYQVDFYFFSIHCS